MALISVVEQSVPNSPVTLCFALLGLLASSNGEKKGKNNDQLAHSTSGRRRKRMVKGQIHINETDFKKRFHHSLHWHRDLFSYSCPFFFQKLLRYFFGLLLCISGLSIMGIGRGSKAMIEALSDPAILAHYVLDVPDPIKVRLHSINQPKY